jgi:molybdate transport repressor ModE-like protein
MERNLGVRLVESEPGGPGGGRSRLTAEAERILELYPRFEAAATVDVKREFDEIFRKQG